MRMCIMVSLDSGWSLSVDSCEHSSERLGSRKVQFQMNWMSLASEEGLLHYGETVMFT